MSTPWRRTSSRARCRASPVGYARGTASGRNSRYAHHANVSRPARPTASSTRASSPRKTIGPGCQASESKVSRTTAAIDALSGAASQTANAQSSKLDPASSGTNRTAERRLTGSGRTQKAERPTHRIPATARLPAASSTSRPLSRSSSASPTSRSTASRSALWRRRQRYGAVTSSSSEAGTAAAWETRSAASGVTWRSRSSRQAMFGVTAEARFTSPASTARIAASLGSGAKRSTRASGAGQVCRPRRHAAVSRREGRRSCQSFATSQRPAEAIASAVTRCSIRSNASAPARASRTAAPRCHSCTRAPRT